MIIVFIKINYLIRP